MTLEQMVIAKDLIAKTYRIKKEVTDKIVFDCIYYINSLKCAGLLYDKNLKRLVSKLESEAGIIFNGE